jgi:hypothetical protein
VILDDLVLSLQVRPLPGARAILEALSPASVPWAIATRSIDGCAAGVLALVLSIRRSPVRLALGVLASLRPRAAA